MSYLKIENLEKSYGSSKILHGISFDVASGEFLSLLGPSGCGKTTTLRCIAGLELPDSRSGTISINGKILSSGSQFVNPEKRGFGMVFQSYAVWPHMNVFENVAFPLRIGKRSERLREADLKMKVFEALDQVHLSGLDQRYGHELSGGQQQRVALARALAMSPQLLLLDEPLSNLDVLLREELRTEIQRITARLKITTVLVTHDQREALSLSHRIIVMNRGKIEAQGTPAELYSNPPSPFVAEFLAGGQTIKDRLGKETQFIPRRWKLSGSSASTATKVKIASRLYLGNEYEYWGDNNAFMTPIKFFSNQRLDLGSDVNLEYQK